MACVRGLPGLADERFPHESDGPQWTANQARCPSRGANQHLDVLGRATQWHADHVSKAAPYQTGKLAQVRCVLLHIMF
jgi:hypothetical protein